MFHKTEGVACAAADVGGKGGDGGNGTKGANDSGLCPVLSTCINVFFNDVGTTGLLMNPFYKDDQ